MQTAFISDVPNPGINKVSSLKTIQQIAYIAMQKMYFDETIAFREMVWHIVMSQLLEIDTLLGIHIATA